MSSAEKADLRLTYAQYVLFPNDGEQSHGDEVRLAIVPEMRIPFAKIW